MAGRSMIAALLALGALLALLPSTAKAKDRGSCATHMAPICHLNQSPFCLCSEASDFSCAWQCFRK